MNKGLSNPIGIKVRNECNGYLFKTTLNIKKEQNLYTHGVFEPYVMAFCVCLALAFACAEDMNARVKGQLEVALTTT